MQPPRGLDPRVLLIVAILGMVGGCWLAGTTASPDDRLVSLLGRLTALQSTSIVVATAIVSATAIFAAVLIPLATVWAIRRSEDTPPPQNPEPPRNAYIAPPQAQQCLPTGKGHGTQTAALPKPSPTVKRRSRRSPERPDHPQGTA